MFNQILKVTVITLITSGLIGCKSANEQIDTTPEEVSKSIADSLVWENE